MDALTWFKSVLQRGGASSALLRADLATEEWADVPLHVAAARLRPTVAPAADAEDWKDVIARAKMQAASPGAPSPRPPSLPRHAPAKAPTPPPPPRPRDPSRDMQDTPPLTPVPKPRTLATARSRALRPGFPTAPRPGFPTAARANPDVIVWGGRKTPPPPTLRHASGRGPAGR